MLKHGYMTVEVNNIKQIKLFDVMGININTVTEIFNRWFKNYHKYNNCNNYPTVSLIYNKAPDPHDIKFEFYGDLDDSDDEYYEELKYELSRTSFNDIMSNILYQ